MTRNPFRSVAAAAAVLASVSCNGRYVTTFDHAAATDPATNASGAVTDHVVVVSIDGLRPDAIERFDATTLQRLMREGCYSLEASTILPSRTLPAHTSMLTGTSADQHHVLWNSQLMAEHGYIETPTMFASATLAGFETAAFFSKAKFRHLQVPGTLDYAQSPSGWPGFWSAERTVDDAVAYLRVHEPNLLFVHLSDPDLAGHVAGWMSRPYGWAVGETDEELARLLEATDAAFGQGEYTLIITADHGGHGRDHGTADPRDVTIPWIAWGEGVAAGRSLPAGIRTMDTAGTSLWLLGVESPEAAVGRPVRAAFTAPAVALAARAHAGS